MRKLIPARPLKHLGHPTPPLRWGNEIPNAIAIDTDYHLLLVISLSPQIPYPTMPPTSAALAQNTFPAGHREQIGHLYTEHHGWLRNWLRQRVGCHDIAADLAQDTFLRLLNRPRPLQGMDSAKRYLRTVADGLCIDLWRRKSVEQAWLETLAARPQAVALSPEDQALVIETLGEIEQMLSQLPSNVATAFIWSQVDGLSYRQIAQQLAVSERMVKKYMARAMLACVLIEVSYHEAQTSPAPEPYHNDSATPQPAGQ